LEDCAVDLISNPDWSEGIASSIRAGVQHAQENDAVLLMTCDQPLVDAAALRQLIGLRLTSVKPIVAAAYAKTIGIPALFDHSFFPELLRLHGDEGAKSILLAHRREVAEFSFPDAAIDVDTPADLEQLER
jgi:molybdenum cofactor cytidylyltransferase